MDYSGNNIKVSGVSVSTVLGGWSVFGELAHTANLPVQINGNDLVNGAAGGIGPVAGTMEPGASEVGRGAEGGASRRVGTHNGGNGGGGRVAVRHGVRASAKAETTGKTQGQTTIRRGVWVRRTRWVLAWELANHCRSAIISPQSTATPTGGHRSRVGPDHVAMADWLW